MLTGPRRLAVPLLGAAAVIAFAFLSGFEGEPDDAEIARLFMTHMAAGETTQAHALLHPSLAERHTSEGLADLLPALAAYTRIDFPTAALSTANGQRSAELTGLGTTASGCESALTFAFLNGAITFFDITPLCRGSASDA